MFSINIARSQKQRVILNNENKSPVLFVEYRGSLKDIQIE